MKRIYALLAAAAVLCLTSCGSAETAAVFTDVRASDGVVTIPTDGIGGSAGFYNYDADGVTVQLVALRDKNDAVHAAFNTCQSCSPSPKAYYEQDGDVLKCANCGFTFSPEGVGVTHGGCNPWPIEGVEIGESAITAPEASLNDMAKVFSGWGGPTE